MSFSLFNIFFRKRRCESGVLIRVIKYMNRGLAINEWMNNKINEKNIQKIK